MQSIHQHLKNGYKALRKWWFMAVKTTRVTRNHGPSLEHSFNGNFRILKWRYCTIFQAIFCGDIPLYRPYIRLIYGRYLQSIGSWNGHWFFSRSNARSVHGTCLRQEHATSEALGGDSVIRAGGWFFCAKLRYNVGKICHKPPIF